MLVGATEPWNETLINSWRVLRTNHKKQEQNEPTLDSRNTTWIINMQQLSLRHKSLSSLFFLLYPSGIFQTSCICPTLTDFLSELPRSVALTNTQTCCEAPREHKTPVIYFDLDFFQALISQCFLLVGQEMASWLCLHCGCSPVLGAGRFCGCVGIFITGIT